MSSEVWSSHLTGSLIDVGDFPNAIAIYKKYIREIRKIFTPKHNFLSTARRRLQRLHERRLSVSRLSNATYIDLKPLQSDVNSTFVSVHVRRSDYSHHLAVLYNLTYVDDDFFRRAFKYFRDKYHVSCYKKSDPRTTVKLPYKSSQFIHIFIIVCDLCFLMGQPWPLLSFIFDLFKQTSLQILEQTYVKNCPSSIQCRNRTHDL